MFLMIYYAVLLLKQCTGSHKIIFYDPLEMCGGVFICRDPARCPYYLIILLCSGCFWATTFGQGVYSPQPAKCTGQVRTA